MENGKATLSPVKLWSGSFSSNGNINVSGADRYNVFVLNLTLYGLHSVILVRGHVAGCDDDLGDGLGSGCQISISSNTIRMSIIRSNYTAPIITEIWGIG